MDTTERTAATDAIGMMLQAFPSSQSSINADSARVYMFAVEEFSLEAIKRACRAIVRGEVKDLKADFPPSAPKLAQVVKGFEDKLKIERFEASNTFVEQGSPLWRKLSLHRKDGCLPSYERSTGADAPKWGWFFPNEEVAEAEKIALPAPTERGPFIAARPGSRVEVGDPEGNADAGEAA